MTAATRSVGNDVDEYTGRYEIAGTATFTGCVVQSDVSWAAPDGTGALLGVIARYTDTSNWLRATLAPGSGTASLEVKLCVARAVESLGYVTVPASADAFYSLRLQVDASGLWSAWAFAAGSAPGAPSVTGYHQVLATGGALASGKAGIYDAGFASD
jgi:hypothetical protein